MLTESLRRTLGELLQEVRSLAPLQEPRDLQGAKLAVWAARYRMLLEEAGPEHGRDREFSRIHGAIRTKMAAVYPSGRGPFLAALHPAERRDWRRELREAERNLEEIVRRHRSYTEARAKLADVESFLAQGEPRNEDEERRLHHLIREGARHENLRGELADLLEPYRDLLPAEFAFLWERAPAGPVPAAGRPALGPRDILSRILRRLIQKDVIGARYCPADMVTLGFDGNARGRAKHAVELLVRHGVLLEAKGGTTLSLSPKWVTRARAFLAGEPLGVPEVDDWACG